MLQFRHIFQAALYSVILLVGGERAKVGEGTKGEPLGMSRRIHVDYAARYRNGGSEPCG
jgi:hypothetical protein